LGASQIEQDTEITARQISWGDIWRPLGAQADNFIWWTAQFVAHYYTTFDADRKALASLYVSSLQSPWGESAVSNAHDSEMTPS